MSSSSTATKVNYNVYLLDSNDDANTNYFTNEQIKFALVKDGTFVAGTSGTEGKKLTDISGFTTGATTGEGLVLENQEIASGKTDEYKLRIWISDDVNYSNTDRVDDNTDKLNDAQTSIGKYNGYKYSLKVKVTSEFLGSDAGVIKNLKVNKLTVTADLEDGNGLSCYAITTSNTAPSVDSSEWINFTSNAKSNIVRTSIITTKSIEHMVKKNGTYYLHVKNKNNDVTSKVFTVNAIGENAVDKIVGLAEKNTNELRIDTHSAVGQQTFDTTEYRYIGVSPNNYVWFNNELWRIIGAMDVEDVNGNVEKRLKIIRNSSIGTYSWDSSVYEINSGTGVNEWSQADIMSLLNNGAYYNRTSGTCYNGESNKTTSCNFTNTGLTSDAKEMIGKTKWYLGALPTISYNKKSLEVYNSERGTTIGKQCSSSNGNGCNDSVTRTTSWTGEIGLMYSSDYGYASNSSSCLSTAIGDYYISCKNTTWLYTGRNQRFITPYPSTSTSNSVAYLTKSGDMGVHSASFSTDIHPVTYLKSNVKILDGNGSSSQPFILSK